MSAQTEAFLEIGVLCSLAKDAVRRGDLAAANVCECAALAGSPGFLGMLLPPGGTPLTIWRFKRGRVFGKTLKGELVVLEVGADLAAINVHPHFMCKYRARKLLLGF